MQELWHGDCLELMKNIPDKSIDMILCDLPYGTTNCSWDIVIPFEKLWEQYNRIAKQNCPILLFSKQPFTSLLISSNIKNFKYELIWQKDKGTDFGNANRKPLNCHENICVFYEKPPIYNKQMSSGEPYRRVNYRNNNADDLNFTSDNSGIFINSGERTPTSVIKISRDNIHKGKNIHPTQKPIKLCEYLIKTYTSENGLVLDNTCGSGSSLLAAKNLGRRFIGIEKEEKYYIIAKDRLGL